MSTFLIDRRPDMVTNDANRQLMSCREANYSHTGASRSYAWYMTPPIGTPDILDRPGLSVLDVGCGEGRVIEEYARKSEEAGIAACVLGVTAVRYGVEKKPFVQVADVNRLMQRVRRKKWDRVITRLTLTHTPDPLAVFEQMLNLVKPGGTITVDSMGGVNTVSGTMINRMDSWVVQAIMRHIVDEDLFEVRSHDEAVDPGGLLYSDQIPSLHLKRVAPSGTPIYLPVGYTTGIDERGEQNWWYVPQPVRRTSREEEAAFVKTVQQSMKRGLV